MLSVMLIICIIRNRGDSPPTIMDTDRQICAHLDHLQNLENQQSTSSVLVQDFPIFVRNADDTLRTRFRG